MENLSNLFCLIIFLLIHVNNGQLCSSSCGDIPISYPFRLPENPAVCGDKDYELSCQNNNDTILNFRKGSYYAKRIYYDDHVIQVVDVNLANGSCGLPSRALSMDDLFKDPKYPGVTNYEYAYTLNYLRCSTEISDLANSRVPCLSDDSSNVYVMVTSYWRSSFILEIPNSCTLISALPSYYYDIEMVEQKNPSYETILKMQESGFDMVWSVECRDCNSKRRSCFQRFNSTTEFACLTKVDDEDFFDKFGGIYTSVSVAFVAGLIFLFRFILLPLVILAFLCHKCCNSRD